MLRLNKILWSKNLPKIKKPASSKFTLYQDPDEVSLTPTKKLLKKKWDLDLKIKAEKTSSTDLKYGENEQDSILNFLDDQESRLKRISLADKKLIEDAITSKEFLNKEYPLFMQYGTWIFTLLGTGVVASFLLRLLFYEKLFLSNYEEELAKYEKRVEKFKLGLIPEDQVGEKPARILSFGEKLKRLESITIYMIDPLLKKLVQEKLGPENTLNFYKFDENDLNKLSIPFPENCPKGFTEWILF